MEPSPKIRTSRQRAALRAMMPKTPSPGGIDVEEMAAILGPRSKSRKQPSLGKRARKTAARRTAREANRHKIRSGQHAENAMIYGMLYEEMKQPTVRRLFGEDSPWRRKASLENDLVNDMEAGTFWIHSLKRNPELTPAEAQQLQDYYLTKLYNIGDRNPQGRGSQRKTRRRKARRVKRKRKKRRRKRTKRRYR